MYMYQKYMYMNTGQCFMNMTYKAQCFFFLYQIAFRINLVQTSTIIIYFQSPYIITYNQMDTLYNSLKGEQTLRQFLSMLYRMFSVFIDISHIYSIQKKIYCTAYPPPQRFTIPYMTTNRAICSSVHVYIMMFGAI